MMIAAIMSWSYRVCSYLILFVLTLVCMSKNILNNTAMKHFTLSEFTYSPTALKYHIDNKPSESQVKNIECLCNLILDPLREAIGHTIYITSGFRVPRLNQLVGGSKMSAHRDGLAADFRVGHYEYLTDWAWCLLKSTAHPYRQYIDQCIYYKDKGFIHIGLAKRGKPRNQFWIA